MTTLINPPICGDCKHFRGPWTCAAFPDKIPDDIIDGEVDHTKPIDGDNGIQFEPVEDEST